LTTLSPADQPLLHSFCPQCHRSCGLLCMHSVARWHDTIFQCVLMWTVFF
jgi:hypothetical protein